VGSVSTDLPYIDEHAIVIAAPRHVVWAALEHEFVSAGRGTVRRWLAVALRAVPTSGFSTVERVEGRRLGLAGAHRFARYRLTFDLVEAGDGMTKVTATSHAAFPGVAGRLYRALVVATPVHVVATTGLLHAIRRRTVASRGTHETRGATAAVAVVSAFRAVQHGFYAGTADADGLARMMTDDVAWHVPGSNALAGDHDGQAAVLRYFARRRDLAKETMRITVLGEVSIGDLVVTRADGAAMLDGSQAAWQTVGIYRVADGRVAECWMVPLDQAAFDEIWR
jgi:ketosteroid isomerase-like protein